MNRIESVRAKCPFYKDIDKSKKQIVCSEESAPYSQIRVIFPSEADRKAWSYDYCEGWLYSSCPICRAISEELDELE